MPALAIGPVHGEFDRGNLLCRDGQTVELIDGDDARLDVQLREMAWATWEGAKVASEFR